MNNDIKILFVDIDWTLLNHKNNKHKYDKKSLKALTKAMNNGTMVFLCTARPYDSVKFTGLFDIFKPTGVIAANGCVSFYEDKLIYHDIFRHDLVKKIEEVSHRHGLSLQISAGKERFLSGSFDENVQTYFKVFYERIGAFRKYSNEDVDAILLFAPKELDEKLTSELPKEIMYFRFADYVVDIRPHQVTKSNGIKATLDYLKIREENALAIGDDFGDISMFSLCKFSACMYNACDEVKPHASYVCKSIDKHGVKDALKHFGVI